MLGGSCYAYMPFMAIEIYVFSNPAVVRQDKSTALVMLEIQRNKLKSKVTLKKHFTCPQLLLPFTRDQLKLACLSSHNSHASAAPPPIPPWLISKLCIASKIARDNFLTLRVKTATCLRLQERSSKKHYQES